MNTGLHTYMNEIKGDSDSITYEGPISMPYPTYYPRTPTGEPIPF